jgi:hypothetical protein
VVVEDTLSERNWDPAVDIEGREVDTGIVVAEEQDMSDSEVDIELLGDTGTLTGGVGLWPAKREPLAEAAGPCTDSLLLVDSNLLLVAGPLLWNQTVL